MHRFLLLTVAVSLFTASQVVVAQEANDELIEMVVGFMSDADKDIRSIAFEQIRTEAKGEAATKRFAAELPKLPAEAQVGLLRALADRGDASAKGAIMSFLESDDADLSKAAVNAIAKLGDASDAPKLIQLLSGNKATKAAARQGLIQLQGNGVSDAIVSAMKGVAVPTQVELMQILTSKRSKDQVPALLNIANGNDATLRGAAMKSLGQLAAPTDVNEMVKAVLKAKKGNERNDAEKNLMFVCRKIEDKDARSKPILTAMKTLNGASRTAMIPSLGRVGGSLAWTEVKKAIASRDGATHMAGIRAISNWPDASVADALFKIAKSGKHADHKRIARMSLLRIAPLPDGRTDAEKLKLLKEAMKLVANDKEKNYGIKRAAPIRIVETLRYVLPFVSQPKYSKEACQSVVELAHDRGLRDSNKAEFHAALDKVIGTTKDATLIDRANRYKAGKTWVKK